MRGWLVRNRIKRMQTREMEMFLKQIASSSTNLVSKLNAQRSQVIERNELLTIDDDYLLVEKAAAAKSFQIAASAAKETSSVVVAAAASSPHHRFGNENTKKVINVMHQNL